MPHPVLEVPDVTIEGLQVGVGRPNLLPHVLSLAVGLVRGPVAHVERVVRLVVHPTAPLLHPANPTPLIHVAVVVPHNALAVLQVLAPLASIHLAVSIVELAFAMFQAVGPLAVVACSLILEDHLPTSVPLASLDPTNVLVAVRPSESPIALN